MYNFEEKVAVITGSARGIGFTCAQRLANEGATVIILDLVEKDVKDAVETLKEQGYKVSGYVCNVADHDSVDTVAHEILDKYSKVDFLINNAGITRDALFHKMDYNQWERVISVNLTGVFNVCHSFVPSMRSNKSGSIVNVSSVSALGNIGQANYSASKAGIIGFTRTLAKELGPYNIRVNAILPGTTNTEIIKTISEDLLKRMCDAVPLRRISEPKEQANVIAFLCSNEASYISGQSIAVDGGLSCR